MHRYTQKPITHKTTVDLGSALLPARDKSMAVAVERLDFSLYLIITRYLRKLR